MKASFDGARKQLSHAFNAVADVIDIIAIPDSEEKKQLQRRMNDLRSNVGGLNCMYDPDQNNDCNEIHVELRQF